MKAKRFFALLPALVLTFSLLALSFCASAASVGMSRKKAVLVVGQSYQLSLTGAKKVPTWKTSDKKIVAVGKNGTVKGISKGTATKITSLKSATTATAILLTVNQSRKMNVFFITDTERHPAAQL